MNDENYRNNSNVECIGPTMISCTQTVFPIMRIHNRKKVLCTTIKDEYMSIYPPVYNVLIELVFV